MLPHAKEANLESGHDVDPQAGVQITESMARHGHGCEDLDTGTAGTHFWQILEEIIWGL